MKLKLWLIALICFATLIGLVACTPAPDGAETAARTEADPPATPATGEATDAPTEPDTDPSTEDTSMTDETEALTAPPAEETTEEVTTEAETDDGIPLNSLTVGGVDIRAYTLVVQDSGAACVRTAADELIEYIEKATGGFRIPSGVFRLHSGSLVLLPCILVLNAGVLVADTDILVGNTFPLGGGSHFCLCNGVGQLGDQGLVQVFLDGVAGLVEFSL